MKEGRLRSAALHLAYSIISDGRNANRYSGTSLIGTDGKETARLSDALDAVKELYNEALQAEAQTGREG